MPLARLVGCIALGLTACGPAAGGFVDTDEATASTSAGSSTTSAGSETGDGRTSGVSGLEETGTSSGSGGWAQPRPPECGEGSIPVENGDVHVCFNLGYTCVAVSDACRDNPCGTPACAYEVCGWQGCVLGCHTLVACDPLSGGNCDPADQDCPHGEKCTMRTFGEGAPWYPSCVPQPPAPRDVGDPCTVEHVPGSGFDDCAAGALCWHVEPETLTGVCVELCTVDPDYPCADPLRVCMADPALGPTVCLPV